MEPTRIETADGSTVTIEPTGTGKLARLRLDDATLVVVAVLDRDDLEALADACTALAETLPGHEPEDEAMPCDCEECVAARNAVI